MRYAKHILLALATLFVATPAYAQEAATTTGGNWVFASLALAFAAALAALGQSKVASSACEGLARNPAARPGIQIALILGLAFIESLVLFTWVLLFLAGIGVVS